MNFVKLITNLRHAVDQSYKLLVDESIRHLYYALWFGKAERKLNSSWQARIALTSQRLTS